METLISNQFLKPSNQRQITNYLMTKELKQQLAQLRKQQSAVLKPLKKYVLWGYGKPCKKYNPLCSVCRAWEAYNILKLL